MNDYKDGYLNGYAEGIEEGKIMALNGAQGDFQYNYDIGWIDGYRVCLREHNLPDLSKETTEVSNEQCQMAEAQSTR